MLIRYRDGKAYTPCEVCEEPAGLCCAINDQPMLWFCDEHYREHVIGAHPDSDEAAALRAAPPASSREQHAGEGEGGRG